METLAADIEALGHTVWFDQELSGLQAWWDQILEQVRRCDLFVFALAPEALNSEACTREYQYAADLGKPILPVLVAEGVATTLLPPALAAIQFVDYRQRDPDTTIRLARALNTVPSAGSLPEPLPPPPEVPISYLGGLAEKVEATAPLGSEEQSNLLFKLRRSLREPENADDARTLLESLRKRHDLLVAIAAEIDELLSQQSVQSEKAVPARHWIDFIKARTLRYGLVLVLLVTALAAYQYLREPDDPHTQNDCQSGRRLASSALDGNADDWTMGGDGMNFKVEDGFISAEDQQKGEGWYFNAPAKFLGDKSGAYGHMIEFELIKLNNPNGKFIFGLLSIFGERTNLYYDPPDPQGHGWTQFRVCFHESDWWFNSKTGKRATGEELQEVLRNLTALTIGGEQEIGYDKGGLRNVIMYGGSWWRDIISSPLYKLDNRRVYPSIRHRANQQQIWGHPVNGEVERGSALSGSQIWFPVRLSI